MQNRAGRPLVAQGGESGKIMQRTYTFEDRVIYAHTLLGAYLKNLHGEHVSLSRDVVDWFFCEVHGKFDDALIVHPDMAMFVADHSSWTIGLTY